MVGLLRTAAGWDGTLVVVFAMTAGETTHGLVERRLGR